MPLLAAFRQCRASRRRSRRWACRSRLALAVPEPPRPPSPPSTPHPPPPLRGPIDRAVVQNVCATAGGPEITSPFLPPPRSPIPIILPRVMITLSPRLACGEQFGRRIRRAPRYNRDWHSRSAPANRGSRSRPTSAAGCAASGALLYFSEILSFSLVRIGRCRAGVGWRCVTEQRNRGADFVPVAKGADDPRVKIDGDDKLARRGRGIVVPNSRHSACCPSIGRIDLMTKGSLLEIAASVEPGAATERLGHFAR